METSRSRAKSIQQPINRRSPRILSCVLACLLLLVLANVVVANDKRAAADVFESLKDLAGDWKGADEASAGGTKFEVTAGGHTVIQTEFPGQPHEMKTIYWLQNGELAAKHYCMLGNQPEYRVEATESGGLRFEFVGGTNLDPSQDPHAHEGVMELEDGVLKSEWVFWNKGDAERTQIYRFSRR